MKEEEWECPECGFIPKPEKEEMDNPKAVLEYQPKKYTYHWYCCPTCETILVILRTPK